MMNVMTLGLLEMTSLYFRLNQNSGVNADVSRALTQPVCYPLPIPFRRKSMSLTDGIVSS
jgi:hypothetical protein